MNLTPPPPNPWPGANLAKKVRQETAEHRTNNRDFPCPNCGADLRFDPGASMMKCTHCEAEIEVPHVDDEAAQVEHYLRAQYSRQAEGDGLETVETPSLNCTTCGASIAFDADEHSRLCPFCDSAIVADVTLQRSIVPQGLIPFAIQEREAHDLMHAWLKGRWFAPSGINEKSTKEHFSGVYVPTWTFDARIRSEYTGNRGVYRGTGKNRRIRWTTVSGTISGHFDDVLVSASQSVSVEIKDALAPWGLNRLETYQAEFLAGFRAENHTIGLVEGYKESQIFMNAKIRDWIKADIGGDRQEINSTHTDFTDETFKHVLLPVWITHYSLEGARYRMSVNGYTGKVYGQRPFSTRKLAIGALIGFLALAALGAAISFGSGPKISHYIYSSPAEDAAS